jgi:hypothetical protein
LPLSQNLSQETDLASSRNLIHYGVNVCEIAESQYTRSQSFQCYEEDAGDDFAEYNSPQIITTRSEEASNKKSEPLSRKSWSFNSNFALDSNEPDT